MNSVHFSSASMKWETPDEIYRQLNDEFHFDFDPCPPKPTFNGLIVNWGSASFCNPPYGREIGKWIQKGYQQWLQGKTVVFLIPSRTDTAWWHKYVMRAQEIRFIKGRIRFQGAKHNAPFPSCIVIFANNNGGQEASHEWHGDDANEAKYNQAFDALLSLLATAPVEVGEVTEGKWIMEVPVEIKKCPGADEGCGGKPCRGFVLDNGERASCLERFPNATFRKEG